MVSERESSANPGSFARADREKKVQRAVVRTETAEDNESCQQAIGNGSIMRSTAASIVVIVFGLTGTAKAMEKEFKQDFGGRAFDYERLQLHGNNAERHVMLEPGGLRMVLPANKKVPVVGVTPRFRVRGDFEITAEFEINKVDKPSAGYGAGATIYVLADTESREAASIGHLHRGREGVTFVAMHGTTPADGQRKHEVKFVQTRAKSGKLRIVRTDSVLRCLYAEGKIPDFKELFQTQFTRADLIQVRLGADSGGTPCAVDTSWKNLSIRAQALPNLHEGRSGRLFYILGFMLAGGVIAGGVWMWIRTKGRASEARGKG